MKIYYRGLLVVSFAAIISAALISLRPSLISEAMMAEIGGDVEANRASDPPQCVKTKNEDAALIASADGPFELGAALTRVPLISPAKIASQRGALTARLATLGPERRIYLVLRDLRAFAQPGVLYKIYLDLPSDTKSPGGAPNYVGVLNFFNAAPLDAPSASASAFISYDITSVVKNLKAKDLLREPTTITILPVGAPASEAKPRIGCIELVEQ